MPSSQLSLNGLASYSVFLRGTFDKLDAFPDFLHVGQYKTAANQYTEKGFTPADREMSEALNTDMYEQLVQGIAAGRKKTEAEVRALIDQGPFLAADALKAGLVDDLAYSDQIDDKLRLPGGSMRELNLRDYTPRVGVVAGPESRAEDCAAAGERRHRVGRERLRRDERGGAGLGHLHQVHPSGAQRPVGAGNRPAHRQPGRLGDCVGRHLAGAGDHARREAAPPPRRLDVGPGRVGRLLHGHGRRPTSSRSRAPSPGSIGVVGGKIVTGGTWAKAGANIEVVSQGRHAEMESPTRPFNPEERAKVQKGMEDFYYRFVENAARSRHMTVEKLHGIAQGRVWTGRQAKQVGLVDELGGLDRALAVAKGRAGLSPNAEVQIVTYPPRRTRLRAAGRVARVAEPHRRRSRRGARCAGAAGDRDAHGAVAPVPSRRAARRDAVRDVQPVGSG